MNKELIENADACYKLAEQRAEHYYKLLYFQGKDETYVDTLTENIESWKKRHINHNSLVSFLYNKGFNTPPKEYKNYIKWLERSGKLDDYLDRSISYIYIRDLGEDLSSYDSKKSIEDIVKDLKNHLLNSNSENQGDMLESLSMMSLYKKSKEAGIETTMIWLINKLKVISSNIPTKMDVDNAVRKIIKIIAGVIINQVQGFDEDITFEERSKKLNEAICLGYSYGITYPFIDDLLDAKVLSPEEEKQYSDLIRTTLITGIVPELYNWSGKNLTLIKYIHSELKDAFEYIKDYQKEDRMESFLNQSYIFFNSQEVDRSKDLSNPQYTNEEIYIPIILKSSSSRLIVRSVISADEDNDFEKRTFFYGIYNQLSDDFTDMFEDEKNEAVTPYTYYLKYHKTRKDLINPFELYWTVISNLIHNIYKSDNKTSLVLLSRAINSLKRFKEKLGVEKYNEVMEIFVLKDKSFNKLIKEIVQKARDVDFFDKLLRDNMINTIRKQRREQEEFSDTIETIRKEISNTLVIKNQDTIYNLDDVITDAANYSIEGSGKRLRPIMAYFMGVNEYGLKKSSIEPLFKSLEYMHTASLLLDDLPSQDNSKARRGRATLHEVYNTAIAELTSIYLTQQAIEEQSKLNEFDAKTVLELISYSTQIAKKMCNGQAMDLNSKGRYLNLEELKTMCFYKTGIAFEACLVMPAILGNAKACEIESLKRFAYYAGIAFQIKDDILDFEGTAIVLGKPVGKDIENNNSTFVTILGLENAEKELWEHYCLAMESLKNVSRNTNFLDQLMNYIINRDH